MAQALALAVKRGRVVVTNIHPALEMSATMSLLDLTLMEKQVVGSLFGSGNPRADIPKLLGLYREGQLDLDGLVTKTYTLDDVNEGYEDMRAGKNIRGVMVYELSRLATDARRQGAREDAAPCCGASARTGRSRRSTSTRPRPARSWWRWKAAGLCHSDEHLVTGDMVPPPEVLASRWACPTSSRSSVATRAPGVVVEVGPGVTSVAAGRPRLGQLHPVVRPLPLLLDRPAEPVRPRRRHLHAGPDHRRHRPATSSAARS